ncbi:hypothetical protein GCM10010174_70160 [Kutzneria viridogrisea]|uniref:hypothetical protein n=1 Tax=Kutzneria viridogrisea TaxID=47990 RepID=UPI00160069CD
MTAVEPTSVGGELWPDDVEDVVDYDFDEAWRERKAAQKPPRIRLFGKVYTLPNSLPAKLILFAVKASRSGRPADSQVQIEEAYELLASLLGRTNLAEILDAGLEMADLPDVLERCQELYKRRQGNPGAPATTGATDAPSPS